MSPTSGKPGSAFELDSGGESDSESTPMGGALEGDSVAEAAVRVCFPGELWVDDSTAAFAGGSEAVGEAEAEAEVEATLEAVGADGKTDGAASGMWAITCEVAALVSFTSTSACSCIPTQRFGWANPWRHRASANHHVGVMWPGSCISR